MDWDALNGSVDRNRRRPCWEWVRDVDCPQCDVVRHICLKNLPPIVQIGKRDSEHDLVTGFRLDSECRIVNCVSPVLRVPEVCCQIKCLQQVSPVNHGHLDFHRITGSGFEFGSSNEVDPMLGCDFDVPFADGIQRAVVVRRDIEALGHIGPSERACLCIDPHDSL